MVEAAPAAPSWRRWIRPVITVVAFAAVAFGLRRMLATFDYDEVVAGFDQVAAGRIALAIAAVVAIHGLHVVRERLAVNFAGHARLPTPKVAMASLISRSLSTLGLATVTGFALRMRLYQALGLDAATVGRITLYNEATFYVGTITEVGVVFVAGGLPAAAATTVAVPPLGWLGPAALVLVLGYVGWNVRRRASITVRGFAIPPLTTPQLVAQLVLPLIDMFLSGYVTYVLLPTTALSYLDVVAVGVVASIAGSLSQIPGGLGVYETMVLAFVPPTAQPQALAALLVRRAVVNLLPIAVGAVLLVAVSVAGEVRRRPSRVALDFARDAVAIATFVVSVLMLIAAAVPRSHGLTERYGAIAQGVVFGAGLVTLVAARGLQQGRRRAWWVAVVLVALRTAAALAVGPHWPSAAVAIALLVVLVVGYRVFPHPGPLFDGERTWWTAWLVTLIGVAWIADAHPDSLSNEVRARTAAMIVVAALVVGAVVGRALPGRRRRRRNRLLP
jgi:phosphatidylglycerol lysyltransferase